jgi:hypothetical protein
MQQIQNFELKNFEFKDAWNWRDEHYSCNNIKLGQNLCKTLTKPIFTIIKPPQIFKSKP